MKRTHCPDCKAELGQIRDFCRFCGWSVVERRLYWRKVGIGAFLVGIPAAVLGPCLISTKVEAFIPISIGIMAGALLVFFLCVFVLAR